MKIAFWSSSPGRTGVTGNLSCISILSARYRPSKIVLFENHSSINNLGSVFLSPKSYDMLEERSSYFVEHGLERVITCCEAEDKAGTDIVSKICLSVFDQKVFYLPGGGANRDLLEYRLNLWVPEVLDLLERIYGTVCVDLSSSTLESSRKILQLSDFIVVNLCQNHQQLSHFFRNFSEIRKKAFYVIGNYDSKSVITKADIIKKYGLLGSQVGTIPYNRQYADALTRGSVVPFLLKCEGCREKDANFEFIHAVNETVCLLEQMCRKGVRT